DVVWLWVNNHDWQGWRVSVVTAQMPPVGPPVPAERATLHPWDPPHPRRLLGQDQVPVEHLVAEADPRVMLDSCRDAALIAVGPRGSGMRRAIHLGSTTDWLVGARRPLAPVVIVRAARQTR